MFLNHQVECVCNGPDLREFLAYEGSQHIAFVKKSPDISVPRLDKVGRIFYFLLVVALKP